MNRNLCRLIAITAIIAPLLHLTSDVLEWVGGGFSRGQLIVNYFGFLPIPFLMMGLYAVQRPRIGWSGLIGAVLYGMAFVYFSHTTLVALEGRFPDYATLWSHLGPIYTFHGALMVIGGVLFGIASLKASVLSRTAIALFIMGLLLNLAISLLPLPDILQTVGSTIRNFGLIGMGIGILRTDNLKVVDKG